MPPKPGEEPTEDGDEGAEEHGSKDEQEDEELEGKRSTNEGRSRRREQGSPFPLSFPWSRYKLPVVTSYSSYSSFPFLFWERPGGGRGSCHGPPADCERSWRTVNGTGLYMILP